MKYLIIMLFIGFFVPSYANPNAVINLKPHYDAQHNLVTPDKVLLAKAIRAYQDGYNKSAMTKFQQSAAFGNSDAQMYIGLMYIKALGVPSNWAKGYAWIKLAAQSQNRKHIELKHNIEKNLKPDELKRSEMEYQLISEDYNDVATLKRRDRWVRKQKMKSTGSRTGSQTANVQTQALNGAKLNSDATSNLETMNEFINEYNFGIVSAGKIKTKDG